MTSPHLIISSGLLEAKGVHDNKPNTIPEIKDEIRRVINGIPQEVANVIKRVKSAGQNVVVILTDTFYHF